MIQYVRGSFCIILLYLAHVYSHLHLSMKSAEAVRLVEFASPIRFISNRASKVYNFQYVGRPQSA